MQREHMKLLCCTSGDVFCLQVREASSHSSFVDASRQGDWCGVVHRWPLDALPCSGSEVGGDTSSPQKNCSSITFPGLLVASLWVSLLALRGRHFSIDHISVAGLNIERHLPSNARHRPQTAPSTLTCGFRTCSCYHLESSLFSWEACPALSIPGGWHALVWLRGPPSQFLDSPGFFCCAFQLSSGFMVVSLLLGRCRPPRYRRNRFGMGLATLFVVAQLQYVGRCSGASGGRGIPPGARPEAWQTRCLNPLFQLSDDPGISPQVTVVVSCLDHNTSGARGWSSFKAVRHHLDLHFWGELSDDVSQAWLSQVGFRVCVRVFGVSSGGCCLLQRLASVVLPGCCCCVCCPRSSRACSARGHRRSLDTVFTASCRIRPSVP